MQSVEHDEAISIYALATQARRLLRRHCPSPLSSTLTPRNDNSEVLQQSHNLTPRVFLSRRTSVRQTIIATQA